MDVYNCSNDATAIKSRGFRKRVSPARDHSILFFGRRSTFRRKLAEIIESRTLTYTASGQEFNVKLNYELMSFDENPKILSRMDYVRAMYTPTVMKFNKFSSFTKDVLKQYQISMEENRGLRSRYSYLVSHLSNDEGVVAFETWLDSLENEMASNCFVDTLTTAKTD